MATSNLSEAQRKVRRNIDLAMDTVIAYAAPTVPAMGNLTQEGMVEELGRLNIARKALEKTEKIVKERLKSMLEEGQTSVRSDNFTMKYEGRERTALDQGAAKAYFEEKGILADYMATTQVPTMTITEN